MRTARIVACPESLRATVAGASGGGTTGPRTCARTGIAVGPAMTASHASRRTRQKRRSMLRSQLVYRTGGLEMHGCADARMRGGDLPEGKKATRQKGQQGTDAELFGTLEPQSSATLQRQSPAPGAAVLS